MRIRKSTLSDFESILKIYDIARQFMVKQGNPNQWAKNNWPPEDLVRKDIESEKSYVCVNDGKIVGPFIMTMVIKLSRPTMSLKMVHG